VLTNYVQFAKILVQTLQQRRDKAQRKSDNSNKLQQKTGKRKKEKTFNIFPV